MIKLFTHTDLDGVGCAILAQKVFGRNDVSIDYCDYNNINLKIEEYINSEEYLNYDFCFITDISLSEEMAKRIDEKSLRNNFQLLDHHSTAESLNKYWYWCKVNVTKPNTGIKTSGTEMFYDFLIRWLDIKKTDTLDRFVQTIRDYDTWRWSELGDDGLICKQINDLFYLYGRDEFIVWAISQLHDQVFPRLYEADKLVLKLRQREIDQYVEEKNKELVGYNILGYSVGVVFAERFSSELGNRLCIMNPDIDFVAIINGMKTVSYRSVKNNIDLGKDIASKFGGGGHAKAAGSQIEGYVFDYVINNIFRYNIQGKVVNMNLGEKHSGGKQ